MGNIMENFKIELDQFDIKEFNSVIIGSGAAGLNCALHLVEVGIKPAEIAIVTENLGGGTSFNAGSDKQTYYKMSIIGDQSDSPYEMAKDLCAGGAMHGDIALIEASNSIREFFHLVQLGVPFPHDKYGAYVGYKTDNDPRQRATSIGPLTSQKMCECLLKAVRELDIKIFDKHYAVEIITDNDNSVKEAIGLIGIKTENLSEKIDLKEIRNTLTVFNAKNVIIATGGPSILYKNTVYPESQKGTLGLAINTGCKLQNLTESQFGLASIKFRWNVSGSYQQVIPRYISIDENNNEVEFLRIYFPSISELSKAIFLKGYQWPFNSERIENYGSSLIDLAVYHEREYFGRRVFLDYTKNPLDFDFQELPSDVKEYLEKSLAIGKKPIDRLKQINEKAIILYRDHGIDLDKEPLEIAVCNQHLNGGVSCDIWWECESIKHLFTIGEANGSHGVHRPGGAALNSGQVGGLRAAQKIGYYYKKNKLINDEKFRKNARSSISFLFKEVQTVLNPKKDLKRNTITCQEILDQIHVRMSKFGSIIRPLKDLSQAIRDVINQYSGIWQTVNLNNNSEIIDYFRIRDALITQYYILDSIYEYHRMKGGSRGSYIIIRDELYDEDEDIERYLIPHEKLIRYKFIMSDNNYLDKVHTIKEKEGSVFIFSLISRMENVREIPKNLGWFESVWKKYSNGDIFR